MLLNAWLDSGEEREAEEDIPTLNFWATLLRPLWDRIGGSNRRSSGAEEDARPQNNTSEDAETVVVVCNRSGVENGGAIPFTSLENASSEDD